MVNSNICNISCHFFLFCFKLTENANILIFIRGLLGFTQIAPSVYVPVWINQFGINEYRTIQITSIQLFQTIGKLLGHLLNLLLGLENWQKGFIIEGIYLLFLAFCCLITSEDYFSRTLFRKKIDEENEKRISCTVFEEQNEDKKNIEKNSNYFSDLIILLKDLLHISFVLLVDVLFMELILVYIIGFLILWEQL